MKVKAHKSVRRNVITAVLVLIILITVSVSGICIYIHCNIQKMNLVSTAYAHSMELEEEPSQIDVITQEDELSTLPEASKETIASVEEQIENNMEEKQTPIKVKDEVFNVLLIGTDTREAGGSGRSDAMMLVSINKTEKKIVVTSILRDIYLKIPGVDKNNRINAAYAFGKADLLLETVEQNFKINVDKYVVVDFYSFIDIVDALGGVNIDVTDKEIPVINNYISEINSLTSQEKKVDWLTKPGNLLLDGKQALGYARNRYVGNSDFERTARQRIVLEQMYKELKKIKVTKFNDLMNIILPQVTTNLTEGEIFSMILSFPAYTSYHIEQWSIPKQGSYTSMKIRGMAVLNIDFELNMDEFQKKVYGVD